MLLRALLGGIFLNWIFAQVPASACDHGIYLDPQWLVGEPNFERLQGKTFRDVYLQLRSIPMERWSAPAFQDRLKKLRTVFPEAKLQGWLGLARCSKSKRPPCFAIQDPSAAASLLKRAERLWASGFDGVHLNIEPIESGNKEFLNLLMQLQKAKPPGKILSIAGMPLGLDEKARKQIHFFPRLGQRPYSWKEIDYLHILPHVDQIMVMNYDTAIRSSEEYSAFTFFQTEKLTELARRGTVEIRLGVPVYEHGRKGVFYKDAENLKAAHHGIRKAWKDKDGCPKGMGLAIFIERELTDSDLRFFEKEWQTSPKKSISRSSQR